MSTIAIPRSRCRRAQQLEDLRLHRDVERGRRLVGDQQLRVVDERHRDHHALAHAAGELVRVAARARRGVGDADEVEQLERALAAPAACVTSRCARTASTSWSPTVKNGCSDDSGSWKIIAMSSPRMRAQLVVGGASPGRGRSKRIEPEMRVVARARQAHHRQARHGLARARLADDPERAPRPARV